MLAVGALLLVAGSVIAWAAMADSGQASAHAFRFDAVYVATPDPEAANRTAVTLDLWFTNVEDPSLRDIRIVAIIVDSQRNVQVAKSDHRLGELQGHQTRNAELALSIDMGRPHRVELLVLVDGLLVARGDGGFGRTPYLRELTHDAATTRSYMMESSAEAFQIRYVR